MLRSLLSWRVLDAALLPSAMKGKGVCGDEEPSRLSHSPFHDQLHPSPRESGLLTC